VTHLKSFTLTALTTTIDPKLARRQRLIERLLEQLQLAKGPTFAPMLRQWRKAEDGTRQPIHTYGRAELTLPPTFIHSEVRSGGLVCPGGRV
jgi:hypothetical protein